MSCQVAIDVCLQYLGNTTLLVTPHDYTQFIWVVNLSLQAMKTGNLFIKECGPSLLGQNALIAVLKALTNLSDDYQHILTEHELKVSLLIPI